MAQDPYRYFRPEARNLLEQFAQGILELEKDGSSAGAVARLLRLAHTLKGAARVVRQSEIAERAHAIEDVLAPFRDRTEDIGRENIDAMLAHLDEIASQIVTLVPDDAGKALGEKTKDGSETAAGAATEAARTIGADTADVDALLDQVAETQTRLHGVRNSAEPIGQLGHLAEMLAAQFATSGGGDSRAGRPQAIAIAEELRRKAASLATGLETAVAQVDRELRQLRDTAEALRLTAVDTVLRALKRTARDAARALGKQVTFEGCGGDIRLDAEVLGVVQSALIQIVRNAVAHGIETESERLVAGKPAAGQVVVSVSRRGSKIAFECRDDGRGIDLAAVQKAAMARGLLDPDVCDMTADDLMGVLLRGGISTAASVTDVSGRGVGLDVVREALGRLGGEVAVRNEPGRGTSFDLVIPRSITATRALLVAAEHGRGAMALPLDGVRKIVRLGAADISCAADGASILYAGNAIPFIALDAALHGVQRRAAARTAIIVAAAEGVAAIGVERLLGTARIVVRPLPDGLTTSPIVVGASLDGEGNPQLMLDPAALVAAAATAASSPRQGAPSAQADAASAKRPVLVVDDSLTTRMLEKSILESAGYDVDVASSGEEGLDLARRKSFALILCDVEMPGIDGFRFVERVRADVALRDIPVILVTSRAAMADRQRGRDAGAHGYIIKSEFNQAELLTMIEPMVG